jgi:hypothetical protein
MDISIKQSLDQIDLYCLVDAASRVVLEESDRGDVLVNSFPLDVERNNVELVLRDSVVHCSLPVFGYKSGERKKYGNEEFRFFELPGGAVSWKRVSHFLAAKHSTQSRNKCPYKCALPPFLTFSDCDVIVNSCSNFFELVQKEIGLSIGFWEVFQPKRLIQIRIDFPDGGGLSCRLTIDSAKRVTIRNLLRLVCKIKEQATHECCLTTDGRNPRDQTLSLFKVLEEKEFIQFQLVTSYTVDVLFRFRSDTILVKLNTPCSLEYAIVSSLKAFNIDIDIDAAHDLFTLRAVNPDHELVLPSTSETPFFKTLEDEDLDWKATEFELIPVLDTIWVGRQGFPDLQELSHPSYSEINIFRNEAIAVLKLDPMQQYQLVLGNEILDVESASRLDEVLALCKRRQYLKDGKPVIRFAENSDISRSTEDSVAMQPGLYEYDDVAIGRLVSRHAKHLWSIDDYSPLSEYEVKVKTDDQGYGSCTVMEDFDTLYNNNEMKVFTVCDVGDRQKQKLFYCDRLSLKLEIEKGRQRDLSGSVSDAVENEEVCLANGHGLVLRSNETPISHKFTVIPVRHKCLVRLHFRMVVESEIESGDWNYSSLFKGDGGEADKSKSIWEQEREVCQTITLEKLAGIAISLWRTHDNSDADDIVMHFDDGSVPNARKVVSNLTEEERLHLWCNVGCKAAITLDEHDRRAVVPDHFPVRLLQEFRKQQFAEEDSHRILDEYFVWPSYRVITSESESRSSSSVFVLSRSNRVVYVATVVQETNEQETVRVEVPVLSTTTCKSLLKYLSGKKDRRVGRLECLAYPGTDRRRLLPASLPLGHIRRFVLYHVTSVMSVEVRGLLQDINRFTDEKTSLTVAKIFRTVFDRSKNKTGERPNFEAAESPRFEPAGSERSCLVDSITGCRIPSTVTNTTLVTLNISRLDVVPMKSLADIRMETFGYWKSGPASVSRSGSNEISFSIQEPRGQSRPVPWQLLSAFLGSTMSSTGLGPFNSSIRPFLILTNNHSEGTVMMIDPNLYVCKFIAIAKKNRKYQLAVGYWKSYEEGSMMTITVRCYDPPVSIQLQAEYGTPVTVEDIAEAVSLQIEKSQSRYILLHGDTKCPRNMAVSDLARCDVEEINVCLTLCVVDELEIGVYLETEEQEARVSVKIGDRSEEIVSHTLAEIGKTAKPQQFELLFIINEEESVPLNNETSIENLLETYGRDPLTHLHFRLRPVPKKYDIPVNLKTKSLVIHVYHPPLITVEKFADSIAEELSTKLKRRILRKEINFYAILACEKRDSRKSSCDEEVSVQVQTDGNNKLLDDLIEGLKAARGHDERIKVTVRFTVKLLASD